MAVQKIFLVLASIVMLLEIVAVPVSKKPLYDRIADINSKSNLPLFEGDIVFNRWVEEVFTEQVAFSAVRNRERLWVTRVVPYIFSKNYNIYQVGMMRDAMRTIENETCIRFKEHENETKLLEIQKMNGCFSITGRDFNVPGAQGLSLADECFEPAIILHELMHALGFWHEQSRPDRNKYIEVFWENIKEGAEENFEKYSHREADLLDIPYDFQSVMHYNRFQGSKNGKPTMAAIGNENLELGNNLGLTPTDILRINRLYECEKANDGKSFVSSWTSFGPCDNRCKKSRQRFCSNLDLSKCPNVNENGVEKEFMSCTEEECYAPVNGHWGRWSRWGECYPDCGSRQRVRQRRCNNPTPKYGGKNCPGDAKEGRACPPKICSFSCNFDEDWCGWTNHYTNTFRFKWNRIKGKTFSSKTGPSKDHTSGEGYYVYVETSSPSLKGDKARFTSKARSVPDGGECISFWYHMYGMHISTLRVILKHLSGKEEEIWKVSGNNGDRWIRGRTTTRCSEPCQVIFEAERGDGYQGDIAIDDISISPGKCKADSSKQFTISPLGCYKDSPSDRALPVLLAIMRDKINWFRYESSLASMVRVCAEKAKVKKYKFFALQFYGECWSGPSLKDIQKHGPSNDCITGKYKPCVEAAAGLCTGKDSTNFIYELI